MILVAGFAYNEKKYLPYMVDYYHNQGCELLILDNFSNDGTYEWLVENNILTERVDTENSFHLSKLQKALMEEISKISPDWIVYIGIDIFYHFKDSIKDVIERAEKEECNVIKTRAYSAFNTGEEFKLPFYENYFYVKKEIDYQMISKYSAGFKLIADNATVSNKKVYDSEGFFINYGMCKPKEEREETLSRRQKAWTLGLNRGYGTHYPKAQRKDWLWKKEELTDIRTLPDWELIVKHHEITSGNAL